MLSRVQRACKANARQFARQEGQTRQTIEYNSKIRSTKASRRPQGNARQGKTPAPLEDLQDQALHVAGLEGVLQRRHLVEDAAERPDVRFVVVGLVVADLRRQVVRGPDRRPGQLPGVPQHLEEVTRPCHICKHQSAAGTRGTKTAPIAVRTSSPVFSSAHWYKKGGQICRHTIHTIIRKRTKEDETSVPGSKKTQLIIR